MTQYYCFFFQHLTALCAVATECVSALAIDAILQMHFLQAGCLWHLLIFLFDYDYTLGNYGFNQALFYSWVFPFIMMSVI